MSIPSISPSAAPAYTGASPQPAPTQPASTQPASTSQPDATAASIAASAVGVAATATAVSINATNQTARSAEPSKEQIHTAIEKIKQALPPNATNLAFSIDKDSQKTVVKVIDSQTNQVIKQFPSKEVLALAKQIGEFQESLGVLIRGQA